MSCPKPGDRVGTSWAFQRGFWDTPLHFQRCSATGVDGRNGFHISQWPIQKGREELGRKAALCDKTVVCPSVIPPLGQKINLLRLGWGKKKSLKFYLWVFPTVPNPLGTVHSPPAVKKKSKYLIKIKVLEGFLLFLFAKWANKPWAPSVQMGNL